jgi:hypothetical protein
MVLTYALPIGVLVGMLRNSRTELLHDLVVLVAMMASVLGVYALMYIVCRFVLHLSRGMAALGAFAASVPNALLMGLSVLIGLYHNSGIIPAALGGIIPNISVTPLTIFLLSLTVGRGDSSAVGSDSGNKLDIRKSILHTIQQPIVWAPVLGFLLVLSNLRVPALLTDSIALLGNAASGVALFSSGVILAGYAVIASGPVLLLVFVKNIAQPLLVWLALGGLGYGNPQLGETTIVTAMPAAALLPMLAVQYKVAERESASILLISTGASVLTIAGFIILTSH